MADRIRAGAQPAAATSRAGQLVFRIIGEKRHDALRLEHRTDAVPDRLATVGSDDFHRDAKMIADEFEQLAQPHRRQRVSKLGRPTNRKIDYRCVEPAASFFDRMDATICSRVEPERA